mgnify:CR=1 FL=1
MSIDKSADNFLEGPRFMSEEKGFFRFLNNCVSNFFSFLIAAAIALFVLVAAGWMMQVWLGQETSSQYFSRFTDFYLHPEETAMGAWARETLKRVRN